MKLSMDELKAGFAAADAEVSRLRITPGAADRKYVRRVVEHARGQREMWRSRLNRAAAKLKAEGKPYW